MASLDPEGVAVFEAESGRYRLYFGMRAYKETERHYDLPFMRAIERVMPKLAPEDMADPVKIAEASADVRLSDLAKLFEFALLKHHPELDEDAVEALIDEIGLSKASELIGEAVSAALIDDKDGGDGQPDANPPKRPSRKR